MLRRFGLIVAMTSAALFSACGAKTYMNIEEIPVPSEARQDKINGSYETALDTAANSVLTDLRREYSGVEDKIFFLPPDVDAAKIFEFYDQNLSAKGFENKNSVQNGRNYQLGIWRKDGWMNDEAVAVAVIDAGRNSQGAAVNFLAVYSARK